MIGRTVSIGIRGRQKRILPIASSAWLVSVVASAILIVVRLNFFPPAEDQTVDLLYDGLTFTLVLFATAAVFLGGERRSLSLARVTALGLYWVVLSAGSAGLWVMALQSRDALRFFVNVLFDHSSQDATRVLAMFLAIQLCALPTVKMLRESFSHQGTARVARQH